MPRVGRASRNLWLELLVYARNFLILTDFMDAGFTGEIELFRDFCRGKKFPDTRVYPTLVNHNAGVRKFDLPQEADCRSADNFRSSKDEAPLLPYTSRSVVSPVQTRKPLHLESFPTP
jgi:hypothetical protein